MHGREISCLMNRDEYGIIPCRDLNIRWFWGFYTDGQEDWAPTGSRNAKISFPLHDKGYHLIGNPDLSNRRMMTFSCVHALLTS